MDGTEEAIGGGLTLRGALTTMRACVRRAARPGWIWVAGVAYPTWSEYVAQAFEVIGGEAGLFHLPSDPGELLAFGLLGPPLLWLLFRLVAGLARVSPPVVWQRSCAGRPAPALRRVFAAGKGLTLGALGLWLLLFATMVLVVTALALPFAAAVEILALDDATTAVLFSPLLAFLVVYGVLLSVLHQLALHSLVHNRRGVASALLHAWRIARASPRDTFRAAVGDAVLSLSVYLASALLAGILGALPLVDTLPQLAVLGIAGVARAGYWARAYRALGGLSPDDGVPGL